MEWLFLAFLAPMLYAMTNLIDEHLVARLFKNSSALVFYASLTNIVFLPLIFFFGLPQALSVSEIPVYLLIGFLGVAYLYPYYKALDAADTSVVVALFSLGKIFVPILAYFLVGELLSFEQYIGIGIIILSSAGLSIAGSGRSITINKSFYWMLLCSLMLALELVLFKYVIIETDWITGFTYGTLFSLVFVMLVPLIPKYRRIIGTEFSSYRQGCKLLIASEFLTFGANAIYIYAMSLTAVSLVNAIDSFQPFFVLLYAFVVAKYIPEFFKENITPANILKKFLFFGCMVLGVLLVV